MNAISRYPVPTLENLPADIKSRVLEVQEKAGFVPNVFLAMAHRPNELRAFMAYHDALMLKESGLSQAEREMVIVTTSNDNGCLYCVVAHGAILRIRAKDALVADQVAVNYLKADISPRQKAMLTFALKVSNNSQATDEEDFVIKIFGILQQLQPFSGSVIVWLILLPYSLIKSFMAWPESFKSVLGAVLE